MKVFVMSSQNDDVASVHQEHSLVDAKVLCNLFLDWSDSEGLSLSPMKLQKLLYFCHAEFLCANQISLIKQSFEAWEFGPVIPSIYREFKIFTNGTITSRAKTFDPIMAISKISTEDLPPELLERIRLIFNNYKHFSAAVLSHLSHMPRGPWRQARSLFTNGLNADRLITNAMIEHFHQLSGE